jgi:Tol biopolymer transport system component
LSPEDARVAYALAPSAQCKQEAAQLVVRNITSGAETTLCDDIWGFTRFSWSPDGTAIAYTSAKDAKIHIVAVPKDLRRKSS